MKELVWYILLSCFLICGTAGAKSGDAPLKNKSYRGVYTWGAEVETFAPCGGKKSYWVSGNSKLLEKLKNEHQKVTTKPYQGIDVTLVGTIDTSKKDLDGFAAEYDGVFNLTSIESLFKPNGGGCK